MTTVAPIQRSYLPVIDRPLDNTALQAYMRCPREYWMSMVLHRRPKGKSAPLVFGTAWHKALEIHYRSNGNRDLVHLAVAQAWEGHDAADDYRTLNRVLLEYDKYVKHYGPPGREDAKTLGSGADAVVEMSTNAQGDDLLHPWAGKIDRIIELNGLYYIEDHKTTSRFDKNYFRQFDLSNQMMGYTYLGKQILPNLNIVGVRINLLHVLTEKSAFHRQLFTFSPPQIKEWTVNSNHWMARLARDYEQVKADIEAGLYDPAVDLAPPSFPGHYGDDGCSRKFGMCAYHPVCSSSPKIRKDVLEREFDINPWNPLEADE